MGQPLTVSVFSKNGDKEPVISVYQHWSGYTYGGLEVTKMLLMAYEKAFSGRNVDTLTLDELFDCTKKALDEDGAYTDENRISRHSGISGTCRAPEDVKKRFPVATDRSVGLIGICTEDHVSFNEEAILDSSIHLDTMSADVDGLFMFEGTEKNIAQINANWDLDPEEDERYIKDINDVFCIDDPGCWDISAEDIQQLSDEMKSAEPEVQFVLFDNSILSIVSG